MTRSTVSERRFSVAAGVFEAVPDYRRAIVVGRRAHAADDESIREALAAASAMRDAEPCTVTDVPTVRRWRRAYRAVGLDPTKARPAVEALIRRARGGGAPSLGRAPIDVGTIVTLLAGVPVGVHVLDDIVADVTLDFATGEESFVTFAGDREHPAPGELVWRAGDAVLARRWVHKQGLVGSVSDDSAVFAVNLDLLGDDDLDAARELLVRWLGVAGIVVSGGVVLDRAHRSGTIADPGSREARD